MPPNKTKSKPKTKVNIKIKRDRRSSNKKPNNTKSNSNSNSKSNQNSNSNSNSIQPDEWVRYYNRQFPEWIYRTFKQYELTGEQLIAEAGRFKPFPYQKFVRDYMASISPYRGLLLYHGLGSGKTCTAIQIAENLKSTHNIVVFLPASLRDNFISKGLKFCADSRYKNNNSQWERNYVFISYNASNVKKQLEMLGSLDNRVIIIDEVHNFVSRIVSSLMGNSTNGRFLYESIMNAKNCKIIALSGTPIINTPAELAILFNMIRGNIEITVFRIIDGDNKNLRKLEKTLLSIPGIDYVDIRLGNKTVELHIQAKEWMPVYNDKVEEIESVVQSKLNISIRRMTIRDYKLFPDDIDGGEFRAFYRYFVDEGTNGMLQLKNRNLFQRRILGLVSYYSVLDDSYPEVIHKGMIEVPMSNYQHEMYMIVREEERAREHASAKKRRAGMEAKTMFRVFSREFSNFVFPEDIRRPFPNPSFEKLIVKAMATGKNNNKLNRKKLEQNLKELESLEKDMFNELEANDGVSVNKKYQDRINRALKSLYDKKAEYLTESGDNDGIAKYSPKMRAILQRINESGGSIFVYSQFTLLEGVEVFSQVLEANGYEKYGSSMGNSSGQRYALYTGNISFEERNEIVNVFNSPANKNGEIIKVLIASSAGAEGLDLKNIRQIHIMEPYWNEIKMEQVIGRGVRRDSHADLPKSERNIEVYRYLAVMTDAQTSRSPETVSTDQHIYDIALKKKLLTNEMLEVLRETAVDCKLNRRDNQQNREYRCFSFGENTDGLAYLPDISYDVYSNVSEIEKKVTVSLIKGLVTDKDLILYGDRETKKFFKAMDVRKQTPYSKKKPNVKMVVYLDLANRKVYDFKAMKKKQKIMIGTYNAKSKFIMT